MYIGICCDNRCLINTIEQFFEQLKKNEVFPVFLIKFKNVREIFIFLKDEKEIDLLFFDIGIKYMNTEVLCKLKESSLGKKVIFLTSSEEYSFVKDFIMPINCLLKPLNYKQFIGKLKCLSTITNYENGKFLIEKSSSGIYKIEYKDVLFIETYNRHTLIHTIDELIISHRKMKEYQSILSQEFFRCHSGYIINMFYVKKVIGTSIVLFSGENIPLSRNRKSNFLESLSSFLESPSKN